MIPQGFLQDLLARADIVDVVGRAVQLKKAGVNYKGLCPFHGEKSPSFIVSPTRQTYHCFGCGVHGNAVGFLMEHGGLGFVEAVKELAGELGMAVPDDDASPQQRERDRQQREQRKTLSDVLAQAQVHWYGQLKQSRRAIDYLKGRGLTGEIAKRFGLGYAPGGWHGLASCFAKYDDPLLVEAGLVIVPDDAGAEQRRYDRFRDRIMFPIRSVRGEVIGFGGRILDQGEPKYLNSPETPVFVKGRELYGLFEARAALRNQGYALVTEGYMDVVALAQLGFGNAVATLGTACTADHVAKLLKFTEQIVFSFDGDAAGRRAAARAMEAVLPHATDTRSFRFLFLPPEHDPDTFVREHGAEAFEALVQGAVPLSRQLLDLAAEGCDLATPEGRARMLATARPWFAQMPDGLLHEQLRAELARAGGLAPEVLAAHWDAAQRRSPGQPRHHDTTPSAPDASAPWSDAPDPWEAGMPEPDGFHDQGHHDYRPPRSREPGRDGRSGWKSGKGKYGRDERQRWNERQGRTSPIGPPPRTASQLDCAAWLLLRHSRLWLSLSAEVHDELARQPAPHGDFFAALERQLHDHGEEWQPTDLLDALRAETDDPALHHLLDRLRTRLDIQDDADPLTELLIVVLALRLQELDDEIRLLAESGDLGTDGMQQYRELVDIRHRMMAEREALRASGKTDRI